MGGGGTFADLLSSWISVILPDVASVTVEFNAEHKIRMLVYIFHLKSSAV
jgi:hypothetical protein